jgi:hypothetical protein
MKPGRPRPSKSTRPRAISMMLNGVMAIRA